MILVSLSIFMEMNPQTQRSQHERRSLSVMEHSIVHPTHKSIWLRAVIVLAITLSGFVSLTTAYAQQTFGNVRGILKDPNGAVVAGAKVTLLDSKTNTSQSTQTTGSGEYEFKNILAGDYQ